MLINAAILTAHSIGWIVLLLGSIVFLGFVLGLGILSSVINAPAAALVAMVFVFFFLAQMASTFYEKYFSICRSAVLGIDWVSPKGPHGLKTLGKALVVMLCGASPLMALLMALRPMTGPDNPLSPWSFIWLVPTGLIAAVYCPMGMAVVAVEGKLNPLFVIDWLVKSMPEYLVVVLFSITSSIAFSVLGELLASPLPNFLERWPVAASMSVSSVGICTNQYGVVVIFTMLGKIVRRKKDALGWDGWMSEPLRRELEKRGMGPGA